LPFVFIVTRHLQTRFGIIAASMFIGALLVTSLVSPLWVTTPIPQGGSAPAIGTLGQKLFYVSLPPYLVQFLCGTVLIVPFASLGQRRASYAFIGLGLLVWGLQSLTGLSGPIHTLMVDLQRALLVIGIGLFPIPFKLPGDLSYGIYLWHMPIINVMIVSSALDTTTHQLAVFVATLISLAALSWIFIESPALKKTRNSRDKPIPIGSTKLTG
jgi:peptidoglycan/LPS O-acetylase OafA/YrhL